MAVECATDTTFKTLIQVGIPSLVTIISVVLTYCTHKSSKEKDILIAGLNNKAKSDGDRATRLATLIESITDTITELENAFGRHSGVYRLLSADLDQPISEEGMAELESAFVDVSKAISGCMGARAKVNLLGNKKTLAEYELFLQSLFGYQRNADPKICTDRFKLGDEFEKVKRQREHMMEQLSSLYLGTN